MSSVADEFTRSSKRALGEVTRSFTRGPFDSKAKARTFSSQTVEPRKGASKKKREAEKNLLRQQQREEAALAEAEGEIGFRQALATSRNVGRRSLIRSATGLSTNLGGTTGG